ncbi:MAG: Xaa-Pro aminopeptidase [Psychromonas sp.]
MTEFLQRRSSFFSKMANNSVAIFPSGQEQIRSKDTEYPFRQNSDFYYLTGFNEPDAYLLIVNKEGEQRTLFFNRKKDKTAEIWNGKRLGQSAAVSVLGVDMAYDVSDFEMQLPELIADCSVLYYPVFSAPELERCLNIAINKLRADRSKGQIAPTQFIDTQTILHEMRLIKTEYEIELMSEAAEISAAGHIRAMQVCQPGMWEYQLASEIHYEFAQQGAPNVAYNSIVAGGHNACILHYTENNQQLHKGDLVLIDAGAEYKGYAGDITRTFPVNGVFSYHQAQLYQLVLDIQVSAISQVKPGIALVNINKSAIKKLVDGLLELGIMEGDSEQLIKDQAYKTFYMHGIGHYLGLDVHDVGLYGTSENPRLLEVGMVITIEPGLYISEDADVDDVWKGIGIRIEDDVLVTKNGAEVLSADVPKSINEIEALMANA